MHRSKHSSSVSPSCFGVLILQSPTKIERNSSPPSVSAASAAVYQRCSCAGNQDFCQQGLQEARGYGSYDVRSDCEESVVQPLPRGVVSRVGTSLLHPRSVLASWFSRGLATMAIKDREYHVVVVELMHKPSAVAR